MVAEGRWRSRAVTVLLVAIVAGCARDGGSDGGGSGEPPEWELFSYEVGAIPDSLACGDTTFTFDASGVLMVITSDGTGVMAAWVDGTIGETMTGTVSGDLFSILWSYEIDDDVECPATGATRIVTTVHNAWMGSFASASLDSVLEQSISDDCGLITDCSLTWQIVSPPR